MQGDFTHEMLMQTKIPKEMLDDLSKEIYINCISIKKIDKQHLEINNRIKLMKDQLKLLQDDITGEELHLKEFIKAGELIKTSVFEDQLNLNRMVTYFHGKWTNQWPVIQDDTSDVVAV